MTKAEVIAYRIFRVVFTACLVAFCMGLGREYGAPAGWATGLMIVFAYGIGFADAKHWDDW